MMVQKKNSEGETSMSEKGIQFRTATFGGFRKEDVLAYLEQSSKAHAEKVAALQRELDRAKSTGAEGEERSAALSVYSEKLKTENDRLTAELTAAVKRRDELEALARQMQAELERLRPDAEAYAGIKDRTAGIELEAHSRAQAIEAEGRRKAKAIQDQTAQWFEKVTAAYANLRTDLNATLGHALREMQRACQNLEDITAGEFAGGDESLKALRKAMEDLEGTKQPPAPMPLDEGQTPGLRF